MAEGHAVYGIDDEHRISYLVDLTQKITLVVERELRLVGFWESIPARNRLKAEIQDIFLKREFAKMPDLVKIVCVSLAELWKSLKRIMTLFFSRTSDDGYYLLGKKIFKTNEGYDHYRA